MLHATRDLSKGKLNRILPLAKFCEIAAIDGRFAKRVWKEGKIIVPA